MGWNDKSEYRFFLGPYDKDKLKELKGFLIGMEAAGKSVPGITSFKELEEKMKLVEKLA